MKDGLRGRQFGSMNEIKATTSIVCNVVIKENKYLKKNKTGFERWAERRRQCIVENGDYKADNCSSVTSINVSFYFCKI